MLNVITRDNSSFDMDDLECLEKVEAFILGRPDAEVKP
jgi:hypothetical protein